jgi:hypothetical protein
VDIVSTDLTVPQRRSVRAAAWLFFPEHFAYSESLPLWQASGLLVRFRSSARLTCGAGV